MELRLTCKCRSTPYLIMHAFTAGARPEGFGPAIAIKIRCRGSVLNAHLSTRVDDADRCGTFTPGRIGDTETIGRLACTVVITNPELVITWRVQRLSDGRFFHFWNRGTVGDIGLPDQDDARASRNRRIGDGQAAVRAASDREPELVFE